ncbi:MAG: hypothetical protein OHK0053_36590 [Microscillaceae bacterium]
MSLVVAVVALFLARTLYLPINQLAEGTRKLGQGDYEVRLSLPRRDELGLLAETFNQTAQALKAQREEILQKNALLDAQKSELASQAEKLMATNEEMLVINQTLDLKVQERTQRLQAQNEKLIEYAHYNSHRLRGPLATILGLIGLIKLRPGGEELFVLLDKLEQAGQNLDKVVHQIQELLQQAEEEESL